MLSHFFVNLPEPNQRVLAEQLGAIIATNLRWLLGFNLNCSGSWSQASGVDILGDSKSKDATPISAR
jgi:hypothetical protein